MLRYNPSIIRNFHNSGRSVARSPFPGRYPTRVYIYSREDDWSYLGKPTREAWAQAVRRSPKDTFLEFIEFDRHGLVRSFDREMGLRIPKWGVSYFCADFETLRDMLPREFSTVVPWRLREGVIYTSPLWKQQAPSFTLDDWYSMARQRLRGNRENFFPVDPEEMAPGGVALPGELQVPVPDLSRVDRVFRQLLRRAA